MGNGEGASMVRVGTRADQAAFQRIRARRYSAAASAGLVWASAQHLLAIRRGTGDTGASDDFVADRPILFRFAEVVGASAGGARGAIRLVRRGRRDSGGSGRRF